MCGIVGTWQLNLMLPQVERALDRIAHRGPDASGVYQAPSAPPTVFLGHRRLSIIDLSEAANQPLQKNGIVIVFNGEIYNYREIRAELEAKGIVFQTSSDTEVALEAFRTWREGAFRRFRGMFALAIFDESKQELVLARDPFGVKPLYFVERRGALAFSSEIKALFSLGLAGDLDLNALAAAFLLMWVPEESCVFSGVRKLPPGTWLRASKEGIVSGAFFELASELGDPQPPVTPKELLGVLEESVRAHMTADVPVATFLSGGLDSSLITVLAARQAPDLQAYTIRVRSKDSRTTCVRARPWKW